MARSPWRTRLLLIGLSAFIAVLVLAALEGGLRLVGLGQKDPLRSQLKYQQLYLPVLRPDQRADGTDILRPIDPRIPYQEVLRQKPANSLRVFTFGGSATAGLGYSPNVTFARHLRGMLEEAYPGRQVEVFNLGIVAIASRQVKQLVGDVVRHYDPDVVVVYSGNNEFLEVHAQKYAEVHATFGSNLSAWVRDTNLFRLLGGSRKPQPPSADEQSMSDEELRVTQHRIIQDVKMTDEEITAVVDDYEGNIRDIVEDAKAHDVQVLLMTVGSNWEWRGRNDLPDDWLDELAGSEGDRAAKLQRALPAIDAKLAAAAPEERSELLFRRATVRRELGRAAEARDDFRAAMNTDPHLRRCLSAMNDRLRSMAPAAGVPLVDTVEVLAARARDGIVGFDEYYDYVHFTPKGVWWTAAAVFSALIDMGITDATSYDPKTYVAARRTALEAASEDALAVDDWLGFSFDKAMVADRDLWKYEKMQAGLDERIAADPADWRALAYRGNARYFDLFSAEGAAADYEAALAAGGDQPAIRANLERLRER